MLIATGRRLVSGLELPSTFRRFTSRVVATARRLDRHPGLALAVMLANVIAWSLLAVLAFGG